MKTATMILGLSALICGSFACNAQSPEMSWYKLVHSTSSSSGTQATAIATDGTKAVYSSFTVGSTSSDSDITFGDDKLFDGAPYDGTSQDNNFLLVKSDADGNTLWDIHTVWGDAKSSQGGLAVTPDGDVLFTTIVRASDGYLEKGVVFTDAKGNEVTFTDSRTQRSYDLYYGRVSSQGEFVWVKRAVMDTTLLTELDSSSPKFISDALNSYEIASDDESSLYITGNFRTKMTFEKADGNEVLTPSNVSSWGGDSQNVVGSMVVVKIDKDGNFVNALQGGDGITASYAQAVAFNDGSVYVYGYLKGTTGSDETSIAGVKVTPTVDVNPFVLKIGKDLTDASWLTCIPGAKVGTQCAVQNVGMTVNGNNVWLAGQFTGKLSNPANAEDYIETKTSNQREGMIVKLDSSNGSWVKGTTSKTDFTASVITGYFKVINAPQQPGKIYVYGYGMNATVGVFLRQYDANTLRADTDNVWTLVTKGGVPSCISIALVEELPAIYITARGNAAFSIDGTDTDSTLKGWTCLLSRFNMPEIFTSGVESVELSNDENAPVEYFDLQGIRVSNPSNGVYIVRQGSKVTKQVIR